MPRVDNGFKQRVFDIVGSIPSGRVMTYGQIAALCGAAYAAWEVGQIAHFNRPDLPWHRVVNKKGGLARGYTQGINRQKLLLEAEGITVDDEYRVNLDKLWSPAK